MAEAHVFEHGQVDEAWRAHAVTIRIRAAVADQIEAEFALRSFDATVGFARLGLEAAELGFGINDWAKWNIRERLLQYLQRLVHFEDANHVTIEHIAVLADRDTEF